MNIKTYTLIMILAVHFWNVGGLLFAANTKPMSIVFVGDSISTGVGASSPANRYTTLVINTLNKQQKKYKFKEINLAISGSTLMDQPWPGPNCSAYPYVLKKVISSRADIVVIQHGTNDNAVGCSIGEFLWTYREFVRTIKKKLPRTKIVCMTICPLWSGSIANPHWLDRANVGIQEIAAYENTLLAHTNFAIHNRRELFPDGIHPNDEGHKIMADSVVKALEANDVKSKDNFDFICNQPRQYRICGYVFDVKPQDKKNTGWVCFYDMGKTGFSYTSDYDVDVTSPFKLYKSDFTMTLKNEKNASVKNKSRWKKYTSQGVLLLPSTNSQKLKATITTKLRSKK